jgi:hypothetical protein
MRNLLFILFITAFVSCKKDAMPYSSEFETSLKVWNSYKTLVNNSYSYTIANYSSIGVISSHTETKIIVQNNKVTGRIYTAYVSIHVIETWTETSTTLNTHNNGVATITLDEIYAKAKNEWLAVDKKQNQIIFTTDNQGFIKQCGYIPNNCADDCFIGITIQAIDHL